MAKRTSTPPKDPPTMLRPGEVAKRWNCSPRHVYRMIQDGELLALNLSNGGAPMWRIPLPEVEKAEKRRQA